MLPMFSSMCFMISGFSFKCLMHFEFIFVYSMCFMISVFSFKCLMHFEFIFVYSMREQSSMIILYVAFQFSQHHLLKRLSPHCIFLLLLSKAYFIINAIINVIPFLIFSF